jgi:hypothetical protein
MELMQTAMRNFALDKRPRHHDFTACAESGVRHDPHKPDATSAIDQRAAPESDAAGGRCRPVTVHGVMPTAGPAEDADIHPKSPATGYDAAIDITPIALLEDGSQAHTPDIVDW